MLQAQLMLVCLVDKSNIPPGAVSVLDDPPIRYFYDSRSIRGRSIPDLSFFFVELGSREALSLKVRTFLRRIRREVAWLHADLQFLLEVGRAVARNDARVSPKLLTIANSVAEGLSQLDHDEAYGFEPVLFTAWCEARTNMLALLREQVNAQLPVPQWLIGPVRHRTGQRRRAYIQALHDLAASQRVLILEGEDLKLLAIFHKKLFPSSKVPLDAIPSFRIGGWGGWQYAVGSSLFIKEIIGKKITRYCILDSDYFTEEQKAPRFAEAANHGVQLHIWRRKEIENYLLVPEAIGRIICEAIGKGKAPSSNEVMRELERIADDQKEEIVDSFATEIQRSGKKLELKGARRRAKDLVHSKWDDWTSKCAILPGKKVLSRLSRWSQATYKTPLSATRIAHELRPAEIGSELVSVLTAIEENHPFPATGQYEQASGW